MEDTLIPGPYDTTAVTIPTKAEATFSGCLTRPIKWVAVPEIRFAVPSGTTTQSPRLQQKWYESSTQAVEWRDVPTVVVE